MYEEKDTQSLYLQKNQYVLLNDPNVVWMVTSGTVQILSSRYEDDVSKEKPATVPIGRRDSLIQISAFGALFGCDPKLQPYSQAWLGVAETDIHIEKIEIQDFLTLMEDHGIKSYYKWIGQWTENIGHFLRYGNEIPPSLIRTRIAGKYTFSQEEIFAGSIDHFIWIKIHSGVAIVFGREELKVTSDDEWLLLCEGIWLQVISKEMSIEVFLDLQTKEISAKAKEILQDGLATLHRLTAIHLNELHKKSEIEMNRQQIRSQQENFMTTAAFREIQSIVYPSEYYPTYDSHLLTAMSIVGQSYGVKIYPPAISEDMNRLHDPIDAIARASKVRIRKVLLDPFWHKTDTGSLLGYLGQDKEPIAILPSGSGYDVIIPSSSMKRIPLTTSIREQIHSEAYMMYKPLGDHLQGMKELVHFTLSGKLGDLLFLVCMGLIATLLGMIVPKVTGALVDTAIPNADRGYIYQLCMILTAVGISSAIFVLIQVLTTVRFSIRTELDAQSALWDRILKFSPNFFRKYSSGDLETRVNAAGEISRELSAATLKPLITGILALLNFLLLWYYSWDLAKIALWFGLLILLVVLFSGAMVRKIAKYLYELEGSYNGLVIQIIGGISKIRVAGSEQRAFNHWLTKYSEKLRVTLRMRFYRDIVTIMNNILPPVCSAFIFWKAVTLIVDLPYTDPQRISIGDFIAFNTAFTLYLTGWADFSEAIVKVLDSISKADRIAPLLEEEPEVSTKASDPGRLKGGIILEDIIFRYHSDGPAILDKVSCEIHPGEYVAFVGPSGSGKSTLLRIMLGFETPEYGRVLYDGQDLSGLDVLAVRRQIGTVLQNGRLNAGNISENIANNAKMTQAEIWDAIADAGLTEDIDSMPMGLHTMVSEGGTNLSGGQRQRLLIARALAIRPKIVLFDEATSALDNKTQSIVSQSLDRRKVTRVVIAHRLSTIISADRIYVLDKGKIVQVGTYHSLMKQEGLFRELVARQIV